MRTSPAAVDGRRPRCPCWRPRADYSAPPGRRRSVEGWPSGRRRTPGTRVYGQPYRGFESLSLRQHHIQCHSPPASDTRRPARQRSSDGKAVDSLTPTTTARFSFCEPFSQAVDSMHRVRAAEISRFQSSASPRVCWFARPGRRTTKVAIGGCAGPDATMDSPDRPKRCRPLTIPRQVEPGRLTLIAGWRGDSHMNAGFDINRFKRSEPQTNQYERQLKRLTDSRKGGSLHRSCRPGGNSKYRRLGRADPL